jgi:hypothetical protein
MKSSLPRDSSSPGRGLAARAWVRLANRRLAKSFQGYVEKAASLSATDPESGNTLAAATLDHLKTVADLAREGHLDVHALLSLEDTPSSRFLNAHSRAHLEPGSGLGLRPVANGDALFLPLSFLPPQEARRQLEWLFSQVSSPLRTALVRASLPFVRTTTDVAVLVGQGAPLDEWLGDPENHAHPAFAREVVKALGQGHHLDVFRQAFSGKWAHMPQPANIHALFSHAREQEVDLGVVFSDGGRQETLLDVLLGRLEDTIEKCLNRPHFLPAFDILHAVMDEGVSLNPESRSFRFFAGEGEEMERRVAYWERMINAPWDPMWDERYYYVVSPVGQQPDPVERPSWSTEEFGVFKNSLRVLGARLLSHQLGHALPAAVSSASSHRL